MIEPFPARTLILGDPNAETIITADDICWGFEGRKLMTSVEARSAEEARQAIQALRRPLPFEKRPAGWKTCP